jgi:hypothetical protein
MNLVQGLKSARAVAVPIVMIESPDPAQTIKLVRAAFENGAKTPIPIVQWDAMNGLTGLNQAGVAALVKVIGADVGQDQWPAMTANPGAALALLAQLPGELKNGKELTQRGSIAFALNLHRYFRDEPGSNNGQVVQGIWNLRDDYKTNRRTLVPIVPPGTRLPAEIAQDVIVFDEPYPDDDALKAVVVGQIKSAGVPELTAAALEGAVDALRGLSAFSAEQITAMSLTQGGLDVEELWQRKIKVIEQTDGLSVDSGPETFDDVRGLANFTEFSLSYIRSKRSATLYVRIDEIEKSFAGLGTRGGPGDNTGTTQDRLGVMLKKMEDNGWTGLIAIGHAGTGKSLVTKALANTATKLTGRRVLSVALDLGALAGGIVGESERKARTAMKVIESLAAGGRVCFVATCNGIDELPPALRRRFKLGTWMFDLPEREEKDGMWAQYTAKFGIAKQPRPDDTDWTGADIRNVCDVADNLECTLEKATQYMSFVAKSDPEGIARLRRQADGFVSASRPGTYRAPLRTNSVIADKRAPRAEEG